MDGLADFAGIRSARACERSCDGVDSTVLQTFAGGKQ